MRAALPFGPALAALAYRDLNMWRNRLRILASSRWRLLGYLPALLFSAAGIAGRFVHRSGGHALLPIPPAWLAVAGTFVPAMAFLVLATAILEATGRGPQLFQPGSPDAYLFAGSALAPRQVVLWLLATRSRLARFAITALLVMLFLPTTFGVSSGQGVAWVTVSRLLAMIPATLSLPLFALSRRAPRLNVRYWGYALGSVGLLVVAADAMVALREGGALVRTAQGWLLAVPPGSFAYLGFTGHWLGVLGLAILAALGAGVTWWLAADCYPELFQGSELHLLLAARRSGRRGEDLRTGVVTSQDRRVPAREWVLLWRWWVLESRQSTRSRIVLYAAAIVAGALAGEILAVGPDWLSVAAAILFALVATGNQAAGTTNPVLEFRTPMWHLVAAPLAARLRVLALGNTLANWSLMATLLIASGFLRPGLLPELIAGAIAVGGYLWLRNSFELLFAVLLPDPTATASQRIVIPIVTVTVLASALVLFVQLVAPLGPAVLLLPLVVLVPAGFGVAALTARLLRGSEIPVALAATR